MSNNKIKYRRRRKGEKKKMYKKEIELLNRFKELTTESQTNLITDLTKGTPHDLMTTFGLLTTVRALHKDIESLLSLYEEKESYEVNKALEKDYYTTPCHHTPQYYKNAWYQFEQVQIYSESSTDFISFSVTKLS